MSEGLGGRPAVVLGTPRKLPKAGSLVGRVVVLDIAFAAKGTGADFDKVTRPFLDGLGDRLALWIDHHDHEGHAWFADDPRFVLATKRQHGACPEMVTPERVAKAGAVDTIVCHDDLDGLYSAAKFVRGGVEPYDGADADARAVDTRIGKPSPLGEVLDACLRLHPRDDELRRRIVAFLVDGAVDAAERQRLQTMAAGFRARLDRARVLAERFRVDGRLAVADMTGVAASEGPYDKTELLLLGQTRAPIAVVFDESTVTAAAQFDSGIDLLTLLGVQGGMPTRVSVPRARLEEALRALA